MPVSSPGTPPWSAAITPRVRAVIALLTVSGVRLPVSAWTSANTGVAPTYRTALVVAMNENDGTTTSSPGPIPATSGARCSAVVQLLVATACGLCSASEQGSSNTAAGGPGATQPRVMIAQSAVIYSGPATGYRRRIPT